MENSQQLPNLCINTFPLVIMVYGCLLSVQHNNQEVQGGVNSLHGLSATQNDHSYLCFASYFLFPVQHNSQVVMLHLPTVRVGRGCDPPLERAGGVKGDAWIRGMGPESRGWNWGGGGVSALSMLLSGERNGQFRK